KDRLESLDRLRQTLGYEATLERGYAVVWDGEKVVTTAKAAGKAKELEIQFADGRHAPEGAAKPARKVAKPAKPDAPDQGSLF
ncbi:MAG: exodeoxyribonuclease VII large subunit, partial [Cognatishimia sp.]|nr:exodeoxyribonuclease VII large subunit [Cognatishimia sp.]